MAAQKVRKKFGEKNTICSKMVQNTINTEKYNKILRNTAEKGKILRNTANYCKELLHAAIKSKSFAQYAVK